MYKLRFVLPLVAVVLLSIHVSFACGQTTGPVKFFDEAPTLSSSDAIVGAWYLTVTSETAPAAFKGAITFSDGGGLVASGQGDVLLNPPPGVPPVATAGHGAWIRTANQEYLFTFRQIFYNADGSYAGGAKIRNSAQLNKPGNEMTGQLIVDYYNENDEVVFTGTGTFTATRIVAEPLTP